MKFREMHMRKVLALAIATCLFSFGFTVSAAEKTLKLGVIAELTGDMPAVGASCKNAAEMAVKEINAAGGVQVGKQKMKVELVIEDNAGKADQSAAAAQKLITQDEVLAIVGPNASRYAIPASEIAESSETVLITPVVNQSQDDAGHNDQQAKEICLPCVLHRSLPRRCARQVCLGKAES
jgi:branched-chain amino acid transport system substrate-binding protein